jgi:hypothetical protein
MIAARHFRQAYTDFSIVDDLNAQAQILPCSSLWNAANPLIVYAVT